jgi:hypothetical protein
MSRGPNHGYFVLEYLMDGTESWDRSCTLRWRYSSLKSGIESDPSAFIVSATDNNRKIVSDGDDDTLYYNEPLLQLGQP